MELDEASIRKAFSAYACKPKHEHQPIIKKLNTAIEALNFSVSGLSRALSFDASYLSRIRTGQRKPADMDKFILETAGYNARTNAPSAIAGLIGQPAEELVPEAGYHNERKYLLTQSEADLAYYKNRIRRLFSKAKPLLKTHRTEEHDRNHSGKRIDM